MDLKEHLKERLIDWIVQGGSAAEFDQLSREIYAAGLTPERLFKGLAKDVAEARAELVAKRKEEHQFLKL